MAAAPAYTPTPVYQAPTPGGPTASYPVAQPYPTSAAPIPGQPQTVYYGAPAPGYPAPGQAYPPAPGLGYPPPPGYVVTGEGAPLISPYTYYGGLPVTLENAHHIAQHLRRRAIWMIILGTIIFIAALTISIVLLATFNIFFFSFVFFIVGGVLIGFGIRYLRMAHHLEHHGTLP